MPTFYIGYHRLVQRYHLPARPLQLIAQIDSSAKGSKQKTLMGDVEVRRFEPKYEPPDTIPGDIQFAFRYEGINLEVLSFLFATTGKEDIERWLTKQPESHFARRAGFLYEWLTGNELRAKSAPIAAYVPVLDERLQFGLAKGQRDPKFRVINNLPGNRNFCPIARKTEYLQKIVRKDLKKRTQETLEKYDHDLLRRAAAFLYLKETHSSFEVEREKPSPDRAQRFADLLREAEKGAPLSEKRFTELQHAIVDARFHEFTYRTKQNWIGEDLGYRKKVDLVPARPEDISDLMNGLVDLSEVIRTKPDSMDPVVAAASLAFGFVFIHPFMDGNGRIHRYLVHEVLSSNGFTPKGIVLPVSAVILMNLNRYVETLERFSKPLQARTKYNPDVPAAAATGNDAIYFRYFDLTDQASFLYSTLERTVEHDLEQEIIFLLGFDAARAKLHGTLDWPAHSLDLFIQLVHQNKGRLSKTKRQSHFEWMTDDEVKRCEVVVVESFEDLKKQNGAH